MPYTPSPDATGLVELAVAAKIPQHKIRRIVESTFGVKLSDPEFSQIFDYQLDCGTEVAILRLFGRLMKTAMAGDGDVRACQTLLDRLIVGTPADVSREEAISSLSEKIARLGRPPADTAPDGANVTPLKPAWEH